MSGNTLGHVSYQARLAPTRFLFGNEIGVAGNIKLARERRSRVRSSPGYAWPDPALQASLQSEAWALVPDLAPPAALRAVQDALWLADDPAASVAMGGRIADVVRYVLDPVERVPALRSLLTPFAADVVRAWFQSEFRIRSVRFWRIAPVPADEQAHHHYGNLWHTDGHGGGVFKMFVQVSDATADGAALRLVPRPATERAMRSGYLAATRLLAPAQRVVDEHTVYFDAPPGAALFADTDRCLHRAGLPPTGSTRGMVQFWFEAADRAPEGGDYFAAIPPDPNVAAGRIA